MFANPTFAFEAQLVVAQLGSGWQLFETEQPAQLLAIAGYALFGLLLTRDAVDDTGMAIELVDTIGCPSVADTKIVLGDVEPKNAAKAIRDNLIEPYLKAIKPKVRPLTDDERARLLDAEAAVKVLNGQSCLHPKTPADREL